MIEIYKSLKYNLTIKKTKVQNIYYWFCIFKGVLKLDIRNSNTLSLLSKFKKDKFRNIWGHDFKIEKIRLKNLVLNVI